MTINERVKVLRKKKGLNQKQLASILGITQSGASYMEQPGNNISDSTIKAICMAFNLNEDWLLNGSEPMFIEPDTFSLDEFVKQRGGTELELKIIKTYFDLDLNTRQLIIKHFKERLTTANDESAKSITVEEAEAEYIKSRSKRVQKMEQSALNTITDKDDKDRLAN